MGVGTSAIRAGRAFVEMFLDNSKLIQGLNATATRMQSFAAANLKLGLPVAAPGIAALGAAVKRGFEVDRLANQFGSSATAISTLRGAFEQAGVAGEELEGILTGLTTKISHAADARDELVHGLTGLRGDMLIGKDINTQLDIIAEKFKGIVLAEDQVRVANELGLGGLLPWLKKGKAGLDELRKSAIENGDALDPQKAKQAAEVYREFNRVQLSLKSTMLEVGKALLGEGKSFADFGQQIRKNLADLREWIKEHKTMVTLAVVAGGVLVTLGTALAAIATATKALTAAVVAYNAVTRISIVLDAIKFAKGNPVAAAGILAATAAVIATAYGIAKKFDETDKLAAQVKQDQRAEFLSDKAGGRLASEGPERRRAKFLQLYDHVHGTFTGPVGQQLGYGENVAQRQLDIAQGIAKDAGDIAAGVRNVDAKIGGLVQALQVR